MDAFGETWDRYPTAVAEDPELGLYRAAWQAGWGPATTLQAGSQRLRDALQDPATVVLAHRLALAVAFSRADIAGFEQSLDLLEDRHEDRVADHLRHWRLLLNTGQRARAVELARTFSRPPDSPAAALMMADLLVELGLMEYATEFLQQQVVTFDFSPEVWQRQADLLMAQHRWNDLRALAVHVRASERIPPDLHGFAWFLEGIAQLQMADPGSARKAFARAVDFPPNDPLLTYRMATWLGQHGQHEPAAALLRRLETEFGGLAEYWLQVVGTAYQNRQFDVMRAAAARGYELATNHPVFINNYAAALLIERTNAPLAVQLTLRQLAMNPGNAGARLNHALALLQNGRLDDAQVELDGLDPNALDAYLRTVLRLGYFELGVRRNDSKAALEAYGGIESRFLMPPQERWLAETRQSLLAASKP
jgi:Flp pilus assembly protein TadD